MDYQNTQVAAPRQIPAGCTKKEYRQSYASPELYKQLKSCAIVGYVLVAVNVVVYLLANPIGLLDAAFMLAMVLLMHKKRMKGSVIALLVYVVFGAIVSLLNGGGLTGWMWVIMCVYALNVFKKMDQEYEALKPNGPEI